jgi:hypothetical protein
MVEDKNEPSKNQIPKDNGEDGSDAPDSPEKSLIEQTKEILEENKKVLAEMKEERKKFEKTMSDAMIAGQTFAGKKMEKKVETDEEYSARIRRGEL